MNSVLYKDLVKGTCAFMCPEKEQHLRIDGKIVHTLECQTDFKGKRTKIPDMKKMIKEYNRSAAGHIFSAEDIRPLPVLEKTIRYLFSDICVSEDISWKNRYEFVVDRLKAICQDITIQGLTGLPIAKLLHPVAKFYIFAAYKMCDYERMQFDHYTNRKLFNEVITTIIFIYRQNNFSVDEVNIPKLNTSFSSEESAVDSLLEKFSNFNLEIKFNNSLSKDDVDMQFNRSVIIDDSKQLRLEEVIAMDLLFNFGSHEALRDAIQLPNHVRKTLLLSNIIQASISWQNGNFHPLIRLVTHLPTILCMAVCNNINVVQRKILGVFSVSHNRTSILADDLQKYLLFSSDTAVFEAASHYGVKYNSKEIQFVKGSFDWDAVIMKAEKWTELDKKLEEKSVFQLVM